jgi:hypothetical protein
LEIKVRGAIIAFEVEFDQLGWNRHVDHTSTTSAAAPSLPSLWQPAGRGDLGHLPALWSIAAGSNAPASTTTSSAAGTAGD